MLRRERERLSAEVRVSTRSITSYGAVAQLGERLNGIQEVRGSIPLSSTTNAQLAQLGEHMIDVHEVRGSIPLLRTINSRQPDTLILCRGFSSYIWEWMV
jgi:hypothetical protein